jgi:hypothetical protein
MSIRASRQQWTALLLVSLILFALASASQARPAKPLPPRASGKVIEIRKTIRLASAGKTYDYQGATLVWKGKGDCSQKEGMPPMFEITGERITLKNATIVSAPDGIHVNAKGVTVDRISFPNVCEDAVTMKRRARDTVIKNCYFRKAADKAIQGTYGQNHVVTGNVFVEVSQALRVKKGVRVKFYDNLLYEVSRAVHADGKNARAEVGKNLFYKVKKPYEAEKGAKISRKSSDRELR